LGRQKAAPIFKITNNAMKPTPAEILKGMPRKYNANTPPIADKGIAEKINKAYFTF
jgi:hypothetical protein